MRESDFDDIHDNWTLVRDISNHSVVKWGEQYSWCCHKFGEGYRWGSTNKHMFKKESSALLFLLRWL